uniref:Putative odorant binding protein 16 n=1 Tax=Conopomorpha sinensis TaxID=940481 RepID=A0A649ZV96_9NEOP|nr:putative odorant binding protein 16 [Conopomorpha sinensis]
MDDDGTLHHDKALDKAKAVFDDAEELKNIESYLNSCKGGNNSLYCLSPCVGQCGLKCCPYRYVASSINPLPNLCRYFIIAQLSLLNKSLHYWQQ